MTAVASDVVVLGVDPGVTCGVVLLTPGQPPLAYACGHHGAYGLVTYLIESNEGPVRIIAAGEEFREGRGAGARQAGAAVTRAVIADLDPLLAWHWRSAAAVKPWSTDKRLQAASLYDLTSKMVDGRDACRHAMYAAVHDAAEDCGGRDR